MHVLLELLAGLREAFALSSIFRHLGSPLVANLWLNLHSNNGPSVTTILSYRVVPRACPDEMELIPDAIITLT